MKVSKVDVYWSSVASLLLQYHKGLYCNGYFVGWYTPVNSVALRLLKLHNGLQRNGCSVRSWAVWGCCVLVNRVALQLLQQDNGVSCNSCSSHALEVIWGWRVLVNSIALQLLQQDNWAFCNGCSLHALGVDWGWCVQSHCWSTVLLYGCYSIKMDYIVVVVYMLLLITFI